MELMAQLKVAESAKGETPKSEEVEGFVPDSNTSDTGAARSFDKIEQDYGEGKITTDEYKKARAKQGLY